MKRLRRLTWVLDDSFRLPGGYRIGLDGIIGLIPGIGDMAGALVSSYIIGESYRMGVSKSLLVRMAFNVGVDTLIGAIPFLGDIFDFAYKANTRNLKLIEDHVVQPERRRTSNLLVAGAIMLGIFIIFALLIVGLVALGYAISGS